MNQTENMTTSTALLSEVPAANETMTTVNNATTMTMTPGNITDIAGTRRRDPLEKLSQDLLMCGLPIILVIGLVGNSFNFTVMRKRRMRQTPISVYLTALAITDSLVLALDFMNNWPKATFQVNLLATSTVVCKLHRYLFNACYTYAAWLVTMISIERFIVISFPLKSKTLCTRRSATIVVSVLPVIFAVFYIYDLFTWSVLDGECAVIPQYTYFMNTVSPWLTGVLYSYVPAAILLVCSTAIVVHLVRANRRRKDLGSSNKQSPETVRVSIVVLTISVMYLVLTVPLTIFYLYLFAAEMFINMPPYINLLRSIVLLLALSNHALNFFFYVFSSGQFRKDFLGLFGREDVSESVKYSRSSAQQSTSNFCKSKDGSTTSLHTISAATSKGSRSNLSEAPSQDFRHDI